MLSPKVLARTVSQLRQLLLTRHSQTHQTETPLLERLLNCQRSFARTQRLLLRAQQVGWTEAARRLHHELLGQLKSVGDAAEQALQHLGRPSLSVPDLRDLVAELRQLEMEFGDLQIDLQEQTIWVDVEPLTLEGTYLGPFAIQLFWERLAYETGSHCFAIVAYHPNPASTNEDVTHPHVNNGNLCPGDASTPIQHALEQGRLADAFCLIRSVLTHYNPDSAYVRLEDWDDTECHDCGSGWRREDLSYCEPCGHDYCADCCTGCLACEEIRCDGCLDRCPHCDGRYCANCLARSAYSGQPCCANCLQTCTACDAEVAPEEIDPDGLLCPPCQDARRRQASVAPTTPDSIPTENLHDPTAS